MIPSIQHFLLHPAAAERSIVMQIIPILLISLKASFIPDPDGQFNQQSTFCVKSFNAHFAGI